MFQSRLPFLVKSALPQAIAAIILCCLALAAGDALIKRSSVIFSLWQLFVMRSGLVIVVLLGVRCFFLPAAPLLARSPGWVVLRSVLLTGMWVAYYAALPKVQLSVAAAVVYTIPLFITLLSALLGGDPVRGRAWFAIGLGFLGVLLVVRPDIDDLNGYELLPLLAALFYAFAMVFTRMHLQRESTFTLALWLNTVFLIVGIVVSVFVSIGIGVPVQAPLDGFLLGNWQPPGATGLLVLGALATSFLLGNLLAAYAYQNGPAPVIAAFDYSYLVFGTVLGFLVFGERPDVAAICGMVMITLAGIMAVAAADPPAGRIAPR